MRGAEVCRIPLDDAGKEACILADGYADRRKKQVKKSVPSKMCVRCAKILPLSDFYANSGWASQSGRDAWCKACVHKFCVNKETLREYCWYNNRRWDQAVYDVAKQKAQYVLATNPDFIKHSGNDNKRRQIEDAATCNQFYSTMNLRNYYSYSDNIKDDGALTPFDEGSGAGMLSRTGSEQEKESEAKTYDQVWDGMFTPSELIYLNQYYQDLEESFVLDNRNIQDYARKVALGSLDSHIKYNLMRTNQCSMKEYKESLDLFDNLCKSANFAECKRKPGETTGLGNLGEIVSRIEQMGLLSKPAVTFPKDAIDMILEDLSHVRAAVGMGSE